MDQMRVNAQQQALLNNQLGAQQQAAFGLGGLGGLSGLALHGDYYGRYGSRSGGLSYTFKEEMQCDLDTYLKNWKGE